MFDIEAAKRLAGIETETSKKVVFEDYPRAIRAKRANPESKIAPNSRNSTGGCLKSRFFTQEETTPEKRYQLWFYRLNTELPGFTRMGLMTSEPVEAQQQLTEIYGRPVTGLHLKNKQERKQ